MVKWFIHRFPRLSRLVPLLRFLEITDMVLSFYERLPGSVKLGVKTVIGIILGWQIQIWAVIQGWVESNWRGFTFIFLPLLSIIIVDHLILRRRNRPLSPARDSVKPKKEAIAESTEGHELRIQVEKGIYTRREPVNAMNSMAISLLETFNPDYMLRIVVTAKIIPTGTVPVQTLELHSNGQIPEKVN